MPRLPQPDSIERRTPQDGYRVQSYRGGIVEGAQAEAATTLAQAAATIADSAQKIGTEIFDARDRSELANARSTFLRAKVDADSLFADDPDHGTWAARYQQQLGQAQQSIAGGISSGRVRAQFNDQASLDTAQGASRLADLSRLRVKDEGRAAAADGISQNREAALKSDDPETRAGLINAAVGIIDAAQSSGFFTASEAQHYRESFVKSYEVDRADRFVGDLDAALDKAGSVLVSDPARFGAAQAEMMQRIDNSGLHDDQKATLRAAASGALASNALQGRIAADPVQAKADIAGGMWDAYLDGDKKAAALSAADVQIARNTNRDEQQHHQASQQAEGKIVQQISADDKSLSVLGIEQDKALSPGKQREMIGVLRQSTLPDPPAAISRDTMRSLFNRIHADETDPLKLRDSSALNEAFASGSLTRADYYRLRQDWADAQTPEVAALGRRKADYLNGVEPLIDKTDPWIGIVDATGKQQFYEYMSTVDRAIERYKKEGKDPYDLFDPSKPDYLGKPAALEPFRKPLAISASEIQFPSMSEDAGRPSLAAIMSGAIAAPSDAGQEQTEARSRPSLESLHLSSIADMKRAGYSDDEIKAYRRSLLKMPADMRVFEAMLKGVASPYSEGPTGFPAVERWLRMHGVIADPNKGPGSLLQAFNEGVYTPVAAGIDAARRSPEALARGVAEAARQAALELGFSEATANAALRDAHLYMGFRDLAKRSIK